MNFFCSAILSNMAIDMNYEIVSERAFERFGLVDTECQEIMCIFIDQEKYVKKIPPNVSMIITTLEISQVLSFIDCGFIIAENPRVLFFEMHNYLAKSNIYPYRRVMKDTVIGNDCDISEYAIIDKKGVVVGDNVIIEPFVIIKANTIIEDNCIIRSGAKIGGEGFEFKRYKEMIFHVKHCGGVHIGKNVEIQYNTCIDRAVYPWDNTIIGDYCKLDNLVYIGHAVKIGRCVMISANVAIGGRTEIGQKSWIGLGTRIRNGIKIGCSARANMGAVVTKDIEDGEAVSGNFAMDHKAFIKFIKSRETIGITERYF